MHILYRFSAFQFVEEDQPSFDSASAPTSGKKILRTHARAHAHVWARLYIYSAFENNFDGMYN